MTRTQLLLLLTLSLVPSAPAVAQIPGVPQTQAPTITIGGSKETSEKVAEVLAALEERDKSLLQEQPELIRWRDDLTAVETRIAELHRLKQELAARPAPSAPPPASGSQPAAPGAQVPAPAASTPDPALSQHVDILLEVLTGTQETIASLLETYRQEQQEVAQAIKLAKKLGERFKEEPEPAKKTEGKDKKTEQETMSLDEVLRYLQQVSDSRIEISLLKARRAGLNEELDQRLKEKRPPFQLPELAPFSGDPASRQQTLSLREEATNRATVASRYRKLYNRHVVSGIKSQLDGIRLEIYESEDESARLEERREAVFLALVVQDSELASSKERLEAAGKRIDGDVRSVQKQLKTLRTAGTPEKETGTFTPWQEYQIRITALQHRLYLLDIERQVETFRAAAIEALHSLLRSTQAPASFWTDYAWYLDEERQSNAREELDTRREAWRQEYSRLSLEEPEKGQEAVAEKVLQGYREVLTLYDTIDARKWEIAWCAELVRFYNDRLKLAQRDTFWYVWRSGASLLMFVVAVFFSVLLNRVTLRPIRKRPTAPPWLRNTLFLSYLASLLGAWGSLIVLTLTNVWGEVFQFDRISQIATVSLFMIGDKEISLVAIATFIGVLVLTAVVNRLVGRFLRQHIFTYFDWDEGIRHAVLAVVKYLILFSGIALGLEFIGIGLSALALFAGVIGIGIGFGLQNVASNFIAGLIILFERPIKKGDVVDAAGLEGRVEEIKARSTTLVTRDKVSVIVPNSEFIGKSVVNLSHGSPEIRLHVPVGVAYGTDVDLVVRVLKQVADSHADVLKNPAPSVRLTSFGDSALAFQLLVWTVNIDDKGKIVSDLNFGIHSAFKKHDIEIPFPQSDVHVRDLPRDAPKPIKS